MSENLFKEFDEVSSKQWKQKIQFDLKGADYNETLIYKSLDGINVKPFYHADDVQKSTKISSPKHWNICEQIYVASAEKSNKRAQEILQKGTESIWFTIPSEEILLETLFKDLKLENTSLYLKTTFLSEDFIQRLENFFSGKTLQVYLQIDIVGNLAQSGNWFYNLQQDFQVLENTFRQHNEFRSVLSVDTSLYQNAGANIPQQLAYALAHANEYLNYFDQKKYLKQQPLKIQFITATGSNYFFEIAKLRALRLIYASLAAEYDLEESCHILAEPTRRNKTLYDYNVNLLRTTTESMSAVLGGADTVCNLPYDSIFHKSNRFGDRIARNQLLILKHESYFDKVANAAQGAYYIEELTLQFAERALEIFKEIENGGGFLTQLKEGVIQRKISGSAAKEQELFNSGELVLIGSNKYENPQDKMKEELQLYPFLKKNPRKTLLQPILEVRLSEQYEQERLKKEEEKISE